MHGNLKAVEGSAASSMRASLRVCVCAYIYISCFQGTESKSDAAVLACTNETWVMAQKSIDIVCAHQTRVGCNQQTEKLSHLYNKTNSEGTWKLHENLGKERMLCIPLSAIKAPDKEQSKLWT